jgi:predicted outer membrane repeat protein
MNGLPIIAANDNLTIVGDGDTIDRRGLYLFRLFDVAPTASLTLQKMTLEAGSAIEGGAIYNQGALTMSGMTVQNNTANNAGGAIYNQGALTMSGVTVQNNTARDAGGAIYN